MNKLDIAREEGNHEDYDLEIISEDTNHIIRDVLETNVDRSYLKIVLEN